MTATCKQRCLIVIAAVLTVLVSELGISPLSIFAGRALAADQSGFGEKKVVTTAEGALKTLKKHFGKKDVVIGDIAEKELYFEAEIKDRKNMVIDKVIVDKRTGRVRSIY
ncbi:MAG: hypothetical protein HZB62_00855 [Nitrospirae bacterium]|nr:hypothetical protein [Nitrospirota bacterium]